MIQEIFHVGVTVSGIDCTLRIYRDRFGMTVLSDSPREGKWIERMTGLFGFRARNIYLTPDEQNRLEFIQIHHPPIQPLEPGGGPFTGVSHVGLKIERLHVLRDLFTGIGTWSETSVRRSGDITASSWKDHDGLRWELFEAADNSGEKKTKRPVEIEHVGLLVSDLGRSKGFYTELLDLELTEEGELCIQGLNGITEDSEINCIFSRLRSPTGQILELRQCKRISVQPKNRKSIDWIGFTHVAFIVENAKQIYHKLKRAEVKFVSEPQEIPAGPNRGGVAYYFFDPDRITLEVVELPAHKSR